MPSAFLPDPALSAKRHSIEPPVRPRPIAGSDPQLRNDERPGPLRSEPVRVPVQLTFATPVAEIAPVRPHRMRLRLHVLQWRGVSHLPLPHPLASLRSPHTNSRRGPGVLHGTCSELRCCRLHNSHTAFVHNG